ncbi:hypothetical protein [Vacuolonema iberomarrocanum]|uniref:hypothetical protein n=1 Tax=Vacuolonema iberomarrocanum TaxID=3454632 RepID=UPI0019F324D3|nr:hypothetical protein [filamentous cyanobacterium LEGE 07170]
MNDRARYLLDLAKRNVQAYIANPKTKAAMVAGSVAEGLCDEYSDCDMSIYYDELPSEDELQLARRQNHGSERLWVLGDRKEGGFAESYLVNGVECQFGHVTIAQWEQDISNILEQFDVQTPLMKALSGTLTGIPLYGDSLIHRWKARIANYPDGLAQAMVEHYLTFVPIWGIQEKLTRRDATLWYAQVLVESAQNILGVLSGLNHLYYSTFQFKRMHAFVEQMKIVPENLGDRLESLFHTDAPAAVVQLEALVRETIELVELHMPQVDTSFTKQRLGWRQQPWEFDETQKT